MLTHNSTPRPSLWFCPDGPEHDVVVASRIQLVRNLSSLPFAHRMHDDDRITLRRRVEGAFQELEETYRALDGDAQPPAVQQFYRHRGFFDVSPAEPFAVVHDETNSFVRLGADDHLHICARSGGLDLHGPRTRCEHVDETLERQLDYAVSLQLGYLGPDVRRVGTGLEASAFLHLAALEHSDALGAIDRSGDHEIMVERSDGLYRVRYCAAAGETEDETLSVLEGYVGRLVHYERQAREELVRRHSDAVAEAASRALGTLLHARRLTGTESAEMCNLLRLAVAAGLMEKPSLSLATELMMLSHDSQVAVLAEDDQTVLDMRRARLIQTVYQNRITTGE